MIAAAKRVIGIFRSTVRLVLSILFVCVALPARAGETVTFFHNDVAGSPLAATDVNGFQVWKENYRPYGDRLIDASTSASNGLWFTGKSFDESTGLSYMGARYYDPVLGRFMGFDPVAVSLQNLHTFNRYAYANNNPLKFNDPTGGESGCVSYNNCANVVLTPEAISIAADFTPVVGDVKGIVEAVRDPSAVNVIAAGIGLVPVFGDAASRTLKTGVDVVENATQGAFELAKAGGKHAGFLKNYEGRSPAEIQKAITSIERQIADHQSWIANPQSKIPNFKSLDPRQQAALINSKWPSDIARQKEQLDILRGLLGGH